MSRIVFILILTQLLTLLTWTCLGQGFKNISLNNKLTGLQGLSSYNVNTIVEDRFGFKWIGTQDGLNRYDGKHFIIYNKSNRDPRHQLLGNVINNLLVDTSRDLIWVTTSYGGLNAISIVTGCVVHALKTGDSRKVFKNEWLKCLAVCGENIWLGTYEGLVVYNINTKTFLQPEQVDFNQSNGPHSTNINNIFVDKFSHVWVFSPGFGITVYDGASLKILQKFTNNQFALTKSRTAFLQFNGRIANVNDSCFIWATDEGLRKIVFNAAGDIVNQSFDVPVNKHFKTEAIYACAVDRNGRLWFSTFSAVYTCIINESKYEKVKDIALTTENNFLNSVMSIFLDRSNNIWMGGLYGVAYGQNQPPAIFPVSKNSSGSSKIAHAFYIYPLPDDSIVYVCTQEGLYKCNSLTADIVPVRSGVKFQFICKLPGKETLILSTAAGLLARTADNIFYPATQAYPELDIFEHDIINSAVAFGDSLMILGTESNRGAYAWNLTKHEIKPISSDRVFQEGTIINTIYRDKKKRAWILSDNAIHFYDPVSQQSSVLQLLDSAVGLPMNIFMDVCEAGGYFWLAVYGKGVVQLDQDLGLVRIFSQPDGLHNTGVYKVFPYKDSLIFVSSNFGIYSIGVNNGIIKQYLATDGLNTNYFEENCGAASATGIYFGGEAGFSIIKPNLLPKSPKKSIVFFTSIRTETLNKITDTLNLSMSSIEIPADALNSEFHFTSMSFPPVEGGIFSYKLNEVNNQWVNTKSDYVSFTGLPPGSYTLQVRTAAADGSWSAPSTITVVFLPKWYQTMLFKVSLAVLISGMLYTFYRYRIYHIRVQEKIRQDIASDLHDDLGGTLNSAKVFTHLMEIEGQSEKALIMIRQSISDAIAALRDTIWVLDDAGDTVNDFFDRLGKFALPVTSANNMEFRTIAGTQLSTEKMSKPVKRAFYLIAKEAVNNSIKYSGATKITLTMRKNPNTKQMEMEIADDGCGLDPLKGNSGNGLKNMQHRAREVGYTVNFANESPGGLRINLTAST